MKFEMSDSQGMYKNMHLSQNSALPLYRAAHYLTSRANEHLSRWGLTLHMYMIMCVLWENPDGTTTRTIGSRTCIEKPQLAASIRSLVDRGYVLKEQSHEDIRKVVLSATESGWHLRDALMPIQARIDEFFYEDLTEEERAEFTRLLRKFMKLPESVL